MVVLWTWLWIGYGPSIVTCLPSDRGFRNRPTSFTVGIEKGEDTVARYRAPHSKCWLASTVGYFWVLSFAVATAIIRLATVPPTTVLR